VSASFTRACRQSGAVLALALGVSAAVSVEGAADHLPYVTPDGVVVTGDWGLYRPGAVVPQVYGPAVYGAPYGGLHSGGMGHYFPTNRNDPSANRRPPQEGPTTPTQPYYRSWGAQSQNLDPNSATSYPPFAAPDVIYSPEINVPGPGPRPRPPRPHPEPFPHRH
jgi:hypothetical protein